MQTNPIIQEKFTSTCFITSVSMSLMSNEEILNTSRMPPSGVTTSTLYEAPEKPCINGLLSPYMGPIDDHTKCVVCKQIRSVCLGHFGHINLKEPVFNTEHLSKLASVLLCFCPHCSRFLLDPEKDRDVKEALAKPAEKLERLQAVSKIAKRKIESGLTCSKEHGGCGSIPYCWAVKTPFLCYKPIAGAGTRRKMKAPVAIEMKAAAVLEILQAIPDEEFGMLGIGRADNMIFQTLPVLPNCARSSLMVLSRDGMSSCENHATYLLQAVVNANRPGNGVELQGTVAAYITSEKAAGGTLSNSSSHGGRKPNAAVAAPGGEVGGGQAGGERGGGKSIPMMNKRTKPSEKRKSLRDVQSGKFGGVRRTTLAGRVNYNGRFVIDGDPFIHPCCVGVPEKCVTVSTRVVRVFSRNQKQLSDIVKGTPDLLRAKKVMPGEFQLTKAVDHFITKCCATKVHLGKGKTIALTDDPKCLDAIPFDENGLLPIGVSVERWLTRGDKVSINRAPTILFSSITCQSAIPMSGNVLRFNPMITPFYHADFDGDEMLISILQMLSTIAEYQVLADAAASLIDPQDGSSLMGLIQWAVYGIWKLTQSNTRIPYSLFCDLLTASDGEQAKRDVEPGVRRKEQIWEPIRGLPEVCQEGDVKSARGYFSGRQLLSVVTPMCFFGEREDVEKGGSKGEEPLVVCAGELVSGVWNKKQVSVTTTAITNTLTQLYSAEVAIEWLWKISRISLLYMNVCSDSITLGDMMVPPALKGTLIKIALEGKRKADALLKEGKPTDEILDVLRAAREECGVKVYESVSPLTNKFVASVESGARGKKTGVTQALGSLGPQQISNELYDGGYKQRSTPNVARRACSVESKGYVLECVSEGLPIQGMIASAASGRDGIIGTAVNTSRSGQLQRELAHGLSFVVSDADLSVRAGDKLLQRVYGRDGIDPRELISWDTEKIWETNDEFLEELSGCDERCKESLLLYRDILRTVLLKKDSTGNTTNIHLPMNPTQYVQFAIYYSERDFGDEQALSGEELWDCIQTLIDEIRASTHGKASTFFLEYALLWTMRWKRMQRVTRKWLDSFCVWILTRYRKALVQSKTSVGLIAGMCLSKPLTQMNLDSIHFTGLESKHMHGVGGVVQIVHFSSKTDDLKRKCSEFVLTPVGKIATSWQSTRAISDTLVHKTLSALVKTSSILYDPDRNEDKTLVRRLQYHSEVFSAHDAGFDVGGGSGGGGGVSMSVKRGSRASKIPVGRDIFSLIGAHCILLRKPNTACNNEGESISASKSRAKSMTSSVSTVSSGTPHKWNPYVARIVLDMTECVRYGHTPESIRLALFRSYGHTLCVSCSCVADREWVLVIRSLIPGEESLVPVFPRKVENPTNEDLRQQRLLDYRYHIMKRTLTNALTQVTISGVENIYSSTVAKKNVMRIDPETGGGMRGHEYMIRAEGLNMVDLPRWWLFDESTLECTDPHAVYASQGILGMYSMIPDQLSKMTSHVGHIHERHLDVIAAQMCCGGYPSSMSKAGISTVSSSAFTRAAFGAPMEMIGEAAAESRTDKVSEIMDAVILGSRFPSGTDSVHLFMDDSKSAGVQTIEALKQVAPPPPPLPLRMRRRQPVMVNMRKRQRAEMPDVSTLTGGYERFPSSPMLLPSPQKEQSQSPQYVPYSPTRPQYDAGARASNNNHYDDDDDDDYMPSSPRYEPSSPRYEPSSPRYAPASPPMSPYVPTMVHSPTYTSYNDS